MSDPDVLEDGVGATEGQVGVSGESNRRGRVVFAAILGLLLLLCGITTVVETWVSRSPDEIRTITENLECLQCHSELLPQFSMEFTHNPFVREQCTTCHTPHGKLEKTTIIEGAAVTWERMRTLVQWLPLKVVLDVFYSDGDAEVDEGGGVKDVVEKQVKGDDSEPTLPKDELCWICHGDMGAMLSYEYPHAPFKNGYCTNCHNPHASEFTAILKQDPRDLCLTCHPLGPELAREQVHPPVEGRFCTNCHDPHSSQFRGILVDNQRDLCFTCHPSVAPLSLKAVQHQPFMYDNCTGCHEPHGSNYMPLLIEGQPAVCYNCHPGIENDFDRPSTHPVSSAELGCAGCHDPHAADFPALISAQGNEMCYQCHASAIRTSYEASAHENTLCVRCHTPHGSNYAPLLLERNPEVCLNCHAASTYDNLVGQNKHPVRPTYYDVNAGTPLTCTSSCHDPHGSGHTSMLRYYNAPLDGNCLICHRATPGFGVGVDY
ncbi:MAG: hypothetical protein Kow0067_06890 [Coriobacteriia bacterium]